MKRAAVAPAAGAEEQPAGRRSRHRPTEEVSQMRHRLRDARPGEVEKDVAGEGREEESGILGYVQVTPSMHVCRGGGWKGAGGAAMKMYAYPVSGRVPLRMDGKKSPSASAVSRAASPRRVPPSKTTRTVVPAWSASRRRYVKSGQAAVAPRIITGASARLSASSSAPGPIAAASRLAMLQADGAAVLQRPHARGQSAYTMAVPTPTGGGSHTSVKELEQKPSDARCSQPNCGSGHPSTEQGHGPSSTQSSKTPAGSTAISAAPSASIRAAKSCSHEYDVKADTRHNTHRKCAVHMKRDKKRHQQHTARRGHGGTHT
eukprot:scaffold6913_cov114-Isochrysis_galbana.AAC.3